MNDPDSPGETSSQGDTQNKARTRLTTSMLDAATSSIGFTLMTFGSGVLVARLLGAEGRGVYGAAQVIVQMTVVLACFSMFDSAVIRLREGAKVARSALPSLLLVAMGVSALAILGLMVFQGSDLFHEPGIARGTYLWLIVGTVLIGIFSNAFIAVETADLNFAALNLERLIAPLSFTILVGVLFIFGWASLPLVLGAFLLGKMPVFIMRLWRFRHTLFGQPDFDLIARISRLGMKLHLATVFRAVTEQIDRLVLIAAWPIDRLGYYFVAVSAAGAGFSMLSMALGLTVLPSLSGLSGEVRRDMFEKLFRLTLLSSVGFGLVVALLVPPLIPLVFGTAFSEAKAYTRGLALVMILLPVRQLLTHTTQSAGLSRPSIEMSGAALALFLGGFLLTRFETPTEFFLTLAASYIVSIVIGLWHVVRIGAARPGLELVPGWSDMALLSREIFRYAKMLLGFLRVRP